LAHDLRHGYAFRSQRLNFFYKVRQELGFPAKLHALKENLRSISFLLMRPRTGPGMQKESGRPLLPLMSFN
jgi:hypothetical protein